MNALTRINDASPIMFHAYERPLYFSGARDKYDVPDHKALVRVNPDNGEPVVLNVVKKSYKVVQNAELFAAIDDGLQQALGADARDATIIDKASYGGQKCIREYRFPSIAYESSERSKIAFRVIAFNAFGGGALKLYAGAIDFFCTNGMIMGDYSTEYAKHTNGVKLKRFTDTVARSVDVFWKQREFWDKLRNIVIHDDHAVEHWLKDKFSERLGLKLFGQYLNEKRTRGDNMWALYSALTYYASHPEDDRFGLRDTGRDHAASTMLTRELQVSKIVNDEQFLLLAA